MKTTIALITLLLVASISVNAQSRLIIRNDGSVSSSVYNQIMNKYNPQRQSNSTTVVYVNVITNEKRDSIQKSKIDSINYNYNHNIIDGEYARKAGRELLHMHSIRNEKEAACYNDSKAAFMCEEKYPYKGYPDVTKYKGYKEYKALK